MQALSNDDILKQLSGDRTKGFIDKLSTPLYEQNFDLKRLIDLTFHPDPQIAFRAAWLLDATVLSYPEIITNHIGYLVKRMPEVTNASCKRHYARMMKRITAPNALEKVRQEIDAIDLENIVEQCFDWMIDPKIKVAVQVFAAETLLNLSDRYDWITDELVNQLQFLMRTGGPAMQSAGKRLLSAIKVKSHQ